MEYLASVELALKNEKTEMEFYTNEAARSKNPLAKSMFTSLAKDEREHMQRIQKLHEKLVNNQQWPRDVPLRVGDTDVRKVLDEMVAEVGSDRDHDDDDVKALKRAAEFESRGSRFYAELARECENPVEKSFFEFLSRIEREHQLSIQDSLAYLQDPESWMLQHGRAGLDGA